MTHAASDSQSPLARWADQPFVYLTTTGRRTGTPHRIEIWFAVEDGALFMLSGGRDNSDWVKNLQADPNVTVELGTETLAGIAGVIAPGTPSDRRARELLLEKYRPYDDNLEDWGRRSLPVVIQFS